MHRVSPFRLRAAAAVAAGTVAAGVLLAPAALATPTSLPTPTLSPSTVVAGKESRVWISGSGCLEAPGAVRPAGVYATVDLGQDREGNGVQRRPDGTFGFDLVVGSSVSPGTYRVEATCDLYDTRVSYPVVTLTVVAPGGTATATTGAAPTTTPATSTTTAAPATTPATGALRGTSANTRGVTSPDTGAATGDTAAVGQEVVKVLTGFRPGEVVTVTLHSTPRTVATATADATGTVRVEFTLPTGTPAGAHTLAYEGNLGTYYQEAFTVTAAGTSPALAHTGASVGVPVGIGAGALALGGGLLLLARRRSAQEPQTAEAARA